MIEEPTLFGDGVGMVRNDHPDTSREAAELVAPKSGTQRRKVYDLIVDRGFYGATDQELQADLPLDGNAERPRRVELCDAKLIADSGRRRRHEGRWCVVWVTAEVAAVYKFKTNEGESSAAHHPSSQ